ncbi:MAG TPA: DPP IV N-terminal domain-containing protein [Vicinamibacterales bacterium]|nr:DPP IV N-terminal domain-containing protein [Vicinamibacterales bacterium]
MRHRPFRPLLVLVLTLAAAPASAQATAYRAPRTDGGQPDLQGVWNFDSGVPLERPPAFASKTFFTKEEFEKQRATMRNGLAAIAKLAPVEAVGFDWIDDTLHVNDLRTSLITYPDNGRLPTILEGVRRMPRFDELISVLGGGGSNVTPASFQAFAAMFAAGARRDSYTDFMMSERCLIAAEVPFVPQITDSYVQIVQSRDSIVLLTEFDRRIVALDGPSTPLGAGRPVIGARRSWTGTSRGRWEGETLVVETKGFNDRLPSFAGAGTGRDKVVTERFTRTAIDVIEYSATVVDPATFRDRIELSFPMARVDARLYEGACHEGNRSLAHALSAARKEDETRPRQQLTVLDRQGEVVGRVGEAGFYSQAAFSPDGSRVAVVRDGASQDIWVIDAATGRGTAITSDAFQDRAPVWSPDGSRIAYVSVRDNMPAIYQRASNGQGGEELLYRHASSGLIVLTDWSPDGRVLCFWSENAMFLLPVSGERTPVALGDGEFFGRGGRFSPNGRLLAFNSNQSGRFQIYVKELGTATNPGASPASARVQVSVDGGVGGIFWRRDGKELFYLSQPNQALMAVDVESDTPLRVGAPRVVFKLPSTIGAPAQLSSISTPDGQRFVFAMSVAAVK